MAKKDGLPTVDVRMIPAEHKHKHVYVNQRLIMAHVGQYAMELFRNEMIAVVPDEMGRCDQRGNQLNHRTSIEACVTRACEGAEKMFAEMHKRGWLIFSPETDDLLAEEESKFGIHHG